MTKAKTSAPIAAAFWMPIDSLKEWAKNPRLNDGQPVEKVAKSIRTFGFVAPICVWESAGRMVAGHTRLKAMRAILAAEPDFVPKGAPGPGLVPVRFHEFTDEAEADAYALADNRLAEEADWHEEALADIVAGLAERTELLDAAGYERAEIADLLPPPPADEDDEPEPESEGHAVTRTLGSWAIEHGDALEVLKRYPDNHFDALLSDPPYGISFMGKGWDYGLPPIEIWQECLRVLKPGAPVITFSATRTFHRLGVSLEDAGFEIRDCFSWLYGSGFPKSLDVSKAIDAANGDERPVSGTKRVTRVMRGSGDLVGGKVRAGEIATTSAASAAWNGYGTALKPAWEPAILARKPLDGTVAQNVARWGVGGLAIDACRIEGAYDATWTPGTRPGGFGDVGADRGSSSPNGHQHPAGRWPANVVLDEAAGAMLDEQTAHLKGGTAVHRNGDGELKGVSSYKLRSVASADIGYGDSGGASRFFYVAKPSRREREAGLREAGLREAVVTGQGPALNDDGSPKFQKTCRNVHPTVKPITLARHLATLLLPPAREGDARKLLVPFSGSGSEVIGALLAGWDNVIGIEREAEYVEIARARIGFAVANPREFEVDDGGDEDTEAVDEEAAE